MDHSGVDFEAESFHVILDTLVTKHERILDAVLVAVENELLERVHNVRQPALIG